ncbi:MAG: hypothetical protein KAR42_11770 [candidate division Zixibacteria bacterium]|nr:hypothetical protein [candidate division Zixibacteria bacterium]
MRKSLQILLLGAITILSMSFLIQCSDDNSPSASGGGGLITGDSTGTVLADHSAVGSFTSISADIIDSIQANYNIYYGHTSHGGQIVTGLNMLYNEDSTLNLPTIHETSDDLGHHGDTSWVPPTRIWLTAHPEYNVVMWSWCGGASDNSEAGINTYLNAMNNLEIAYPNVLFIYMTGHLDGTGPSGNLYQRNNQIREYCSTNYKVLFDFADIESYDPDGTFYPDESDGCSWCVDWCTLNDCESCGSCAHSHCFNCYIKGKAFWWMMAKIHANQNS